MPPRPTTTTGAPPTGLAPSWSSAYGGRCVTGVKAKAEVVLLLSDEDDDGAPTTGAPTTGLEPSLTPPPLPRRRRRRSRAASPGQKENIEKDTVAGPAAGPAEPSVMSSAGPLVLWSSACGAMRGHLRTQMRRRQNVIFIDRTSDLHFYFLLLP